MNNQSLGLSLIIAAYNADGFNAEKLKQNLGHYANWELLKAANYIISNEPTWPESWGTHWKDEVDKKPLKERLADAAALIAAEIDRVEMLQITAGKEAQPALLSEPTAKEELKEAQITELIRRVMATKQTYYKDSDPCEDNGTGLLEFLPVDEVRMIFTDFVNGVYFDDTDPDRCQECGGSGDCHTKECSQSPFKIGDDEE